jgi:hypothetical protein
MRLSSELPEKKRAWPSRSEEVVLHGFSGMFLSGTVLICNAIARAVAVYLPCRDGVVSLSSKQRRQGSVEKGWPVRTCVLVSWEVKQDLQLWHHSAR